MKDLQKDLLIDMFAKNSIVSIEQNRQTDLITLMDVSNHVDLLKITEYNIFYNLVKSQKEKIEVLAKDNNPVLQLKNTILYLYNKKENDPNGKAFKIFMQLTEKCLFVNWSDTLKEKFELARKYFLTGFHFFVSYTTRNRIETNKDYKNLIIDVYDEQFYETNKNSNNLVVSVIARCLKGEGLKTFFDKDILESGDILEDKIGEYCSQSFAFIQFVEKIMFREINEKDPNWCYFEYSEFNKYYDGLVKSLNSQIYPSLYFFISDPDGVGAFPVIFPPDYNTWKNDIDIRKIDTITKSLTKAEIKMKLITLAKRITTKREKALGMFLMSLN